MSTSSTSMFTGAEEGTASSVWRGAPSSLSSSMLPSASASSFSWSSVSPVMTSRSGETSGSVIREGTSSSTDKAAFLCSGVKTLDVRRDALAMEVAKLGRAATADR